MLIYTSFKQWVVDGQSRNSHADSNTLGRKQMSETLLEDERTIARFSLVTTITLLLSTTFDLPIVPLDVLVRAPVAMEQAMINMLSSKSPATKRRWRGRLLTHFFRVEQLISHILVALERILPS